MQRSFVVVVVNATLFCVFVFVQLQTAGGLLWTHKQEPNIFFFVAKRSVPSILMLTRTETKSFPLMYPLCFLFSFCSNGLEASPRLMWVLYFQGKACYWLTGSRVYTIGRKDTDIVVVDDASISRCHVTIEIGSSVVDRSQYSSPRLPVALSAAGLSQGSATASQQLATTKPPTTTPCRVARPFLRITDSSKYGTTVSLVTQQHTNGADHGPAQAPIVLRQKMPFDIPSDIHAFEINLGTHGMSFHAVYEPVSLCVSNLPEMALPSLEAVVARLGFHMTPDPTTCDVFVTEALEPTQDLVVALCLARPIVVPAYLEAVLARKNCKIPLPDPAEKRFIPALDPFWLQFAPPSSDAEALQHLFLPRKERRYLFADMTFVCVQQSLNDEVVHYLSAARGRVICDLSLWSALAPDMPASEGRSKLQAFCLRHQRHVLLYTTADALPAPVEKLKSLLATGDASFGLTLVDYEVLLKCILLVQRVVVAPSPARELEPEDDQRLHRMPRSDTAFTRSTTVATMASEQQPPNGRRTGKILFGDEDDPPEEEQQMHHHMVRTLHEAGGWRGGTGPEAEGVELIRQEGAMDEERMPIHTKLRLPPFPCFLPYTSTYKGGQIGPSGKLFQKQSVTVSSRYAEYEAVRPTAAAEDVLTSRIARIDATNLFDDEVPDLVGIDGRFNAFDTAEEHTHHRRRTTAKKAPAPSSRKSKPPVPSKSTLRVTIGGGGDDVRESQAPAAERGHRGDGGIDIFAVDALF